MRIVIDQLARQLQKQTPNILLLNGSEILLVEEALDGIRAHFREQGFLERLSYNIEPNFNWDDLVESGQNMSLFSESRLIEIRMPSAKPGNKGAKFFIELTNKLAFSNVDDVYLIITESLSKQQRSAKWLNLIESTGLVVDVFDIKPEQLPQWLKQRFQTLALRVEAGVIDALASATEGNLLAAGQIMDQLQVLAPDGAVTLNLLEQTLEDQSRFSVYNFVDSCLLGVLLECIHRLERIRAESDNAVLVVWSLAKETRELLRMAYAIEKGMPMNTVLKQHRVWSTKQRFVSAALNRLNVSDISAILEQIATLDALAKGQRQGDIWLEIEKLSLRFCGVASQSILTNNSLYG